MSTIEMIGLPYVDHDARYKIADEYLTILYKYVKRHSELGTEELRLIS